MGESLIRTFSLLCYCIVLPHEITSFRLLMGNHHQELSTAALSFLLQFIFNLLELLLWYHRKFCYPTILDVSYDLLFCELFYSVLFS